MVWIELAGDRFIQGEIEEGDFGPLLRGRENEWLLFRSEAAAGRRARKFMAELARRDTREFARLIGGKKVLVRWSLGRPAGPGTVKVCSLKAYLDLWLTDFAALYDVEPEGHLIEDYPIEIEDDLGFRPGVAYRRVPLVA